MKLLPVLLVIVLLNACSSPEEVRKGIVTPDASSVSDGTCQGRAFIFPVLLWKLRRRFWMEESYRAVS